MSLRALPEIDAKRPPETFAFEADPDALERWSPGIHAEQTPENTISVLDVIGEDFWTGGGVTSKRVASALRAIGEQEVFVDINSPGGDFFEGVAIYNLLRLHPAKVTVRILGMAASAASVISMAGDSVQIGKAGFVMVHNAWVVAIGNRHDMREAADTLETFDEAMTSVYSDRAGVKASAAARWMDDETWFNGEDAIAAGLADSLLSSDAVGEGGSEARASLVNPARIAEARMTKGGATRTAARQIIKNLKGMPDAALAGMTDSAGTATRDAGDWSAAARQLIDSIKS
ncbi:head maturation protease, ClpP-related [Tropicimonas marinistellae]|uniref:head maturation protease, ClpP-related n=1 Tax=Tropicimonas marinistellae TaxID=1739787 RepID=UPI00082AE9CC|nr:head maturation protease, ClpP-related [Tropicimonas marinistellae]